MRSVEQPRAQRAQNFEVTFSPRHFDVKTKPDGTVARIDRVGAENGRSLSRLFTLRDFLIRNTKSGAQFDTSNYSSRERARQKLEKTKKLLESIPGHIEHDFSSKFSQNKEEKQLVQEVLFFAAICTAQINHYLAEIDKLENVTFPDFATMEEVDTDADAKVSRQPEQPQKASRTKREMLAKAIRSRAAQLTTFTLAAILGQSIIASAQDESAEASRPRPRVIEFSQSLGGTEVEEAEDIEFTSFLNEMGSVSAMLQALEASLESALGPDFNPFKPNVDLAGAQPVVENLEEPEVSQAEAPRVAPTPAPVEPTATSTPLGSSINTRSLPTTGSDVEIALRSGTTIEILASYMVGNELWYQGRLNGQKFWVRHDVINAPSKPVRALTVAPTLPLYNEPQTTLLDYSAEAASDGINFVEVEDVIGMFAGANNAWPAETFTPQNLALLDTTRGKVLIQRNDIRISDSKTNEAGSIFASFYVTNPEGGRQLTAGFWGPVQHRDALSRIQVTGLEGASFSANNVPDGFVRFGDRVLFNYEQATLALLANVGQYELIQQNSIVVEEGSFPTSAFTIIGDRLVFESGEQYDLLSENGYVKAIRVEGGPVDRGVVNPDLFPAYQEQLSAPVELTDTAITSIGPVEIVRYINARYGNGQEEDSYRFSDYFKSNVGAGIRQMYLEMYMRQDRNLDIAGAEALLAADTPITIRVATDALNFIESQRFNSNNSIEQIIVPSKGMRISISEHLPFPIQPGPRPFDNTFFEVAYAADEQGTITNFGFQVFADAQGKLHLHIGTQADKELITPKFLTTRVLFGIDHVIRAVGRQGPAASATPRPPHSTEGYTAVSEPTKNVVEAFGMDWSDESRNNPKEGWEARVFFAD